jgi:hypothetical protein
MQTKMTLGKKGIALLVSLTMALALFGIVSMPKKAFAGSKDTVSGKIKINSGIITGAMAGASTITMTFAPTDSTSASGTLTVSSPSGCGINGLVITLPASTAVTEVDYGWSTDNNVGPNAGYVVTATITKINGSETAATLNPYGPQSAYAPVSTNTGTAADMQFTVGASDGKTAYPNSDSSSTTVSADIQGQLTLTGGDASINFGSNTTGSPANIPTPKGSAMYVTSNMGVGYKLQAFASTNLGAMNLNGSQTATLVGQDSIPWGSVAAGNTSSDWNVVFSATQGNAPGDAEGTIASEFGAATGAKSATSPFDATGASLAKAVTVASLDTSTNGGNTAVGGDKLIPAYNIALYNGLNQGTFATTITYTLTAATTTA